MRELHSTIPQAEALRARREATVLDIAQLGLLSDEHPVCGVIDLDTLDELMDALVGAYADVPDVLHTIAAKATTLRPVLARFAEHGFGCEVASPGERDLALASGFAPERLVFDSPAKTRAELMRALEVGIAFNVDNFAELERVDSLIGHAERVPIIGMRINPQTGFGAIEAMSTAAETSKFGVGLRDNRKRIVDAFAARPWLTGLHVHSGSQGVELEHAAQGVKDIAELAADIESVTGRNQITRLDIGGGLPVNFASDEVTPTFDEHRAAMQAAAPTIFDGRYEIVTEFGRSLTAKAGMLVTRVEYAKITGGRAIAVTHAGAQVATRTVFMPQAWPLRIKVFTSDGAARNDDIVEQDVVGPACFAGDALAIARKLPRAYEGDLVAVPDTGGYYFSVHYSYNALARVPVFAVQGDDLADRSWSLARRGQTLVEVVAEAGEAKFRPLDFCTAAAVVE